MLGGGEQPGGGKQKLQGVEEADRHQQKEVDEDEERVVHADSRANRARQGGTRGSDDECGIRNTNTEYESGIRTRITLEDATL